MQLNFNQKSKMQLIVALGLLFSLVSCGSYQYAGYEDDGIYSTTKRNIEHQTETINEPQPQSTSYFKNYFQEKSLELDYLTQEDEVFTDIDSYESNTKVENDTLVDTIESYPGWGQNSSEVTINVYGSYLFNPYGYGGYGYGYGYGGYGYGGYGYGGYWSPYYGGYYSYYHNPYRYYGHRGYGGYGGYGYGGYGYSNYGYYGNNYNNSYNRRGVAYNSGRRGSVYTNSNTSRLRSITRNSSLHKPRTSNTRASTRTVTRPRTSTRDKINSATTRPYSRTRSRINTRSNTPSRSSTRTRSYNTPSRNSSTRSSSSRSSTRSSSSRSSTRSSSPSRSSSRSSGSRSSSSKRGNNI